MNNVQYTLLDNALDYLVQASKHAGEASPRDWKFALLHLASGVELLLKAKLQQEHWSLIFAKPDQVSKALFASGQFQSIDSRTAIERLSKAAGIDLSPEDRNLLESIRTYRNRVQHFAIDVEEQAIKSLMGKGFAFTVRFIEQSLSGAIDDRGKSLVQDIVVGLKEYEEFTSERMNQLLDELSQFKDYAFCFRCDQCALGLGNGNPRCLFCGLTSSPEEIAFLGDERWLGVCPECKGPCYNYLGGWYCFKCGQSFEDTLRFPSYQRQASVGGA